MHDAQVAAAAISMADVLNAQVGVRLREQYSCVLVAGRNTLNAQVGYWGCRWGWSGGCRPFGWRTCLT